MLSLGLVFALSADVIRQMTGARRIHLFSGDRIVDGDKHVVKIDLNEMLRQQWRWFRNIGIVMIVLGVLAIALPLAAALTIGLLLGWLLLLGGVV